MASQVAAPPVGSLEREITEFYTNRDLINVQLESTERLLTDSVSSSLSPEFSSQLRENLKFDHVKKKVAQLYRGNQTGSKDNNKPCIIIVGQTKSGKSSFINELLGGTFVAQSQSPCTARVTRLTYSDRPYVLVRSKTGDQIGDTKYLEKPTIDENLVKLKDEERENEELISSTVEAGIKCEFLRHGIDIIDSPGLNENSSLDSLTLGAVDSFLPIIIYVIDSNSGVTLAVQKDLKIIQRPVLGVEVFYLVTKMDVAKEAKERSDEPEQRIEDEKAERVFQKLQKLGYISQSDTRQTCKKFLCVSCWEVRKFRRGKDALRKREKAATSATAKLDELRNRMNEMENSKWVKHFEEVKTRILKFAQDQFKNLIVSAGTGLRGVHCQILTMFMDKAHDIKESNMQKRKALDQIRNLENEIHEQSKTIVERHRDEFLIQASHFFAEKRSIILDEVESMNYTDTIIEAGMTHGDIEKKCIDEIHGVINDAIVVMFSKFLKDGALKRCFEEFESLKTKVAEFEKDLEQTPAYQVLKSTLLDGCSFSSSQFIQATVFGFVVNIGRILKAFFLCPKVLIKRLVNHPNWKRLQAQNYLQNIDCQRMVDCLINSMKDWFDNRHQEFVDKICFSEKLVESSLQLTEKERLEIKSLYPRVARIHMTTLDVVSRYKFRGFRLDLENGIIGSGGQNGVFRVLDESGAPALAAKRVVSDDQDIDNIPAEVYHSSVMEHQNLVRVVGVKVEAKAEADADQTCTLDLYMELLHWDAWTLMQRVSLPVKQRLRIGLELANALVFLHHSYLIHCNVAVTNVWLSEDLTQVKLINFGLASKFGGHEPTTVPVHLAPELVRGENLETSADIFSLGIALWYLLEGTGRRHPEYAAAQPNSDPVALIGREALDCRPRALESAPEGLWRLMTECWSDNPCDRPSAAVVVATLKQIVDSA